MDSVREVGHSQMVTRTPNLNVLASISLANQNGYPHHDKRRLC
ncbi:hypothetical protein ACIKP9_02885 [Methylobacillus methanolivorans]|uniref:Uncharacterized protein n=1 Tax=Methylobacillus methanolivorans TaxID=1848927 RepID=A0ABW8GJA2_9PROT